jgi:hypothetical protein
MSFRQKSPVLSREQRQLWREINDIVREGGGWVVSQVETFPSRVEIPMENSELPELLEAMGYSVRYLGSHERLLPCTIVETRGTRRIATTSVAPGVVSVFELSLIKKPIATSTG